MSPAAVCRGGLKEGLPSVETLTVAFVDIARQTGNRNVSRWLIRPGFAIYLRFWRNYPVADELLEEVIVIANVQIDPTCRGRGWFWRYCQLCAALAASGVVIEAVGNARLHASLTDHPEFEAISESSFLLRKRTPGSWPLVLPPGVAGAQEVPLTRD